MMKTQMKWSIILIMILSLTACSDMTKQNGGESFQEMSVSEELAETDTSVITEEASESLFQKEHSFILQDDRKNTGLIISLADCKREYSSENFRIYTKYIDYHNIGAVIYLQTPDKSMQLFPSDYMIDKENGNVYVLFADEEKAFISMYLYGAETNAGEAAIGGTKVMTTYMVEDWLLASHALEADEVREAFSDMRVKLKDLLYKQGEVILTGEASGIYKMTGEKYYVDWELNTTSGEENVTPCILKIYDKKEDKEVFSACANAFDLVEQGDLSVVELFDGIQYLERGENYTWQRVDVNGDGLPELIRSDVYREDLIPQITYIFSYEDGEQAPVKLIFRDLNDLSEYYFLGADGKMIYDYSDHGEIQYGSYSQYQYDVKWNRRLLDRLEIYYFEKGDYYGEETDWYREAYPDTYGTNGGGYYFFQSRPKTMEELKDNEEDTYWVREVITKDAFIKAYRRMTGRDFFTQKGDFVRP